MKKNYQKEIIGILSDRVIAFPPILARIAGSIEAGLMLSQLLYWHKKGKNKEWIYKTIDEFEGEIAMKRKQQDTAISKLKKLNLIDVKLMGVPAKRHFSLNYEKLIDMIEKSGHYDDIDN